MQVDREAMPMSQRRVPMRMDVRLRSFPALMLMLMMRVVHVQVAMLVLLVEVLDHLAVGCRPHQGADYRRSEN